MNLRDLIRNIVTGGAVPLVQPGSWSALPLRLVTGLIFIAYGADKLFNNSANFGMNAAFFQALGIPFPDFQVVFIGALEFFGGIALIVGLFSKVFGLLLTINMIVALLTSGNYYLEGPMAAMSLSIFLQGAGPLSLDYLLFRGQQRPAPAPL